MAGVKEVELLRRPPTDFRRMVSWELSEVKERVKKKKKRKKSQMDDGQLIDQDVVLASSEEDEVYSSEEEFYSAPESPLSSDEGTNSVFTTTQPARAVDSVALPEAGKRHGSLSKKKKKHKAQQRKVAREEFFRPMCELFEDEDSVLAVSDLSLIDMGNVLSLTELCLIKIQQVIKTHNFEEITIPYIFQMMITQDRILKSTAAVQMRWVERNFAILEMFFDMLVIIEPHGLSHLAIHHQPFWPATGDFIPSDAALHCPIPQSITYTGDRNVDMGILRMLLHFCDFLFPLFGATGSGLDKVSSQMTAMYRVNHFLKTRYPKVTKRCAESMKLWPAYVCWARGHVRQAADLFMEAVSTLKDKCDKVICLNELGRMMSWYGDRQYSVTFFRKSLDAVLDMLQDRTLMQEERLTTLNPKLVQASSFAMMASNWDVGTMDRASARGAKLSWQAVLKEYATVSDRGVSIWYFHEAAMESQLCFHSAHPVDDIDASIKKGRRSMTTQWMKDCEEFGLKHAPNYPVLYYHLSLINALAKLPEESRKNFRSYVLNSVLYFSYQQKFIQQTAIHEKFNPQTNYHAGFQEWPEGRVPGNPLGLPVPINHRPSPWEAMINLTTDDMKTVPVLPLCWRTRLLHPLYPYLNSKEMSYLADHCSQQINLHFTEDGYLTGDMSMDFPPMRCVLLDPFTGKVCFSQSSALAHYSGQFYCPVEYPAQFAAPQPLRLLTTDWCSVELVAGYSHDLSVYGRRHRPNTSCYHTILHWYGSDGTHVKLDVRRIIRKSIKDSLMNLFHTDKGPLEDKIKRVEAIIDKGLIVNWGLINSTLPLSKINKYKQSTAKTSKERKSRISESVDFYLHMTHHCVIGDNTLLLTFQLDDHWQEAQPDDILVFVPCSSVDSFMNPAVHHSVDSYTVWLPEFEHTLCYHSNHLPHIRYVYTTSWLIQRPPWKLSNGYVQNDNLVSHKVFDEYGKVVFSNVCKIGGRPSRARDVKRLYNATSGDRLYKFNDDETGLTSTIECLRILSENQSPDASLMMFGTQPHIHTLPGCLVVCTTAGVYILDPITLTPMPCKMLQTRDSNSHREDDGIPRPQFDIANCVLTILSVFNINWSSNKKKQNIDNDDEPSPEFPDSMDSTTLVTKATVEDNQSELSITNSCCVAMAINSRLIVMKVTGCEVMMLIDVELPGMITEFHDTGGNGYLVASSVFHNRQREDVYWLSREGRLLGVIPCLGSGPHSFCTKFLEHKSSGEDDEDHSGTYTFFNDGYGGISSVKLIPP